MNKEEFSQILEQDKILLDKQISLFLNNSNDNELYDAIKYALDGGKRIRPILFIETYKMVTDKPIDEEILDFSIAIEKIHAYSLIHDDLPCMDDDEYRRGKYTVHKKFGEDIALLAGDSLLNNAYESLLLLANNDEKFLKASLYVARCAGLSGMIDGQLNDIKKTENYNLEYVLNVYENKTAKLFMAAIVSAGLIAGLDDNRIAALERYALNLGLSFQLEDDLLDNEDIDELNILNVIGYDEALSLLKDFNKEAILEVSKFSNNEFHKYLINYLSNRTN